jgi:hypothetical protein
VGALSIVYDPARPTEQETRSIYDVNLDDQQQQARGAMARLLSLTCVVFIDVSVVLFTAAPSRLPPLPASVGIKSSHNYYDYY